MKSSDNRDSVLTRFKEGPALLENTLADLHDAELDTPPAQGGWTIRQIVHHVVDGDDIWKIGIKAALGNHQPEFTLEWYWTQSQDVWVERWAYAHRSLDLSLAYLKATRNHVRQLLDSVPDGWQRSLRLRKPDGEIKELSVGDILEMQTHHVEHHVNRILAIKREISGT